MKPGRELDALVAEKVMGYHVEVHHPMGLVLPEPYISRAGALVLCPAYSTDIAAAWGVMDRLKADKDNYFIELIWDYDNWYCPVTTHSVDKQKLLTGWSSAPLAICLAALRVYGHEFDEEDVED